jgi:hypothetical protein
VSYETFGLFFVHIMSTYIHIHMKIGKEKGEKEKDKGFSVSWARGGFRPSAGAVARWRGRAGPRGGEMARADAVSVSPRVRERGKTNDVRGRGANRLGSENRPSTRFHGGSPAWFRFWVVGEVG